MSLDYVHHQANMDMHDAEDSAFYARLTSQILHLMDDDDETFAKRTIKSRPEFDRRPVSGGQLISGKYYGWLEGSRSVEVPPSWMENLWAKNGGGTGVFIPHVVAAAKPRRRRHRRPRKNINGERIHSSNGQMIHG